MRSMSDEDKDEEARLRCLDGSGAAWRKRNRQAWQSEPERHARETGAGLSALPCIRAPGKTELQLLRRHSSLNSMAAAIDAVTALLESPGKKAFKFEDGHTPSRRNSQARGPVRQTALGRLVLSAMADRHQHFWEELEFFRVHPYIAALDTATRHFNALGPRLDPRRMTRLECLRLNAAVRRARQLARSNESQARTTLVQLREAARKNVKDLSAYYARLCAAGQDLRAHCFTAGHLYDVPTGIGALRRRDAEQFGCAIVALNAHYSAFLKAFSEEYRSAHFLRRTGVIAKLEYCGDVGVRFLIVVLMPAGHPLGLHLPNTLRAAWTSTGPADSYMEPVWTGLRSRKPSVTDPPLLDQLVGRLVDVDRILKLDLSAWNIPSDVGGARLTTLRKDVLLPV